MAIQSFKDIIDSKGYRINSKDREIFETSNLQSFFGLSNDDGIEFIVYDVNDNQLPQSDFGMVRYVPLTSDNIRDYFLIADGTLFQAYNFPNEYFIDVERLLNEAGFTNGIFKTQITLINKRLGSNEKYDKVWISEISPSRTEVRLLPLKRSENQNSDLFKRYGMFLNDKHFRDDTIEYAIQFVEKINPTQIASNIKSKYGDNWFEKLQSEFQIKTFDVFITNIHTKFMQSVMYELTNRNSDIFDLNYGKLKNGIPDIELSKEDIQKTIIRLLIKSIDYHLSKPAVKENSTYKIETDDSLDIVGQVLQRKSEDTLIDTKDPVLKVAQQIKVNQTNADLELEKAIEDEKPKPKPEPTPEPTPPNPQKPATYNYTYRGNTSGTIYWTDSMGTQRSMYTNVNQDYQIGCAQVGTLSGFGNFSVIDVCGDTIPTGGNSGKGGGGTNNNPTMPGDYPNGQKNGPNDNKSQK